MFYMLLKSLYYFTWKNLRPPRNTAARVHAVFSDNLKQHEYFLLSPGSTPSWTAIGCWWCMLGRWRSSTLLLLSAEPTTPSSSGWSAAEDSDITGNPVRSQMEILWLHPGEFCCDEHFLESGSTLPMNRSTPSQQSGQSGQNKTSAGTDLVPPCRDLTLLINLLMNLWCRSMDSGFCTMAENHFQLLLNRRYEQE